MKIFEVLDRPVEEASFSQYDNVSRTISRYLKKHNLPYGLLNKVLDKMDPNTSGNMTDSTIAHLLKKVDDRNYMGKNPRHRDFN